MSPARTEQRVKKNPPRMVRRKRSNGVMVSFEKSSTVRRLPGLKKNEGIGAEEKGKIGCVKRARARARASGSGSATLSLGGKQ